MNLTELKIGERGGQNAGLRSREKNQKRYRVGDAVTTA